MNALRLPGGSPGQLVYSDGALMPGRIFLAPVGARLPSGVLAVVAEVVAPGRSGSRAMGLVARAAAGSGVVASAGLSILSIDSVGTGRGSARGAGMLFLRGDVSAGLGAALASASAAGGHGSSGRLVVTASAGSEAEGGVDNGSAADKEGGFVFYDFIATQALDALRAADELVAPTAQGEIADVKHLLESAVRLTELGSEDKMALAVKIMDAWYRMAQITHGAYGQPRLPDKHGFIVVCLSKPGLMPPVILNQAVPAINTPRNVPDTTDAHLVNSVLVAVAVCQATARAVRASGVGNGSTPDDKEGTFVFEDFISTQALEALAVVDGLLLPPTAEVEVSARLCDVKGALESAVVLPGSSGDKRSMAVKIMTAWYRVAQLTHAAYNLPGLPSSRTS